MSHLTAGWGNFHMGWKLNTRMRQRVIILNGECFDCYLNWIGYYLFKANGMDNKRQMKVFVFMHIVLLLFIYRKKETVIKAKYITLAFDLRNYDWLTMSYVIWLVAGNMISVFCNMIGFWKCALIWLVNETNKLGTR